MATIRHDIPLPVPPAVAWDALRDYHTVHERVARGFVTDSRPEGDDRVLTFVTGAVARERLVALDDERRRLVYTVVDGPLGAEHHQSSVEVADVPGRTDECVLVWITDVLPHQLASPLAGMMELGAAAIRATLGVPSTV